MSQRSLRVNELIRREISDLLHTFYQGDAVYITITEVSVAPDLRTGHVYYSVLGDEYRQREAEIFFKKNGESIRRKVGKQVVLKYLPHLKFIYDSSMERGANTLNILDELDQEDHGSN
jgi:ribosome-binding factor A